MEGFLRALGFGNKPDYAEKIPETLTAKDFGIQETFHHGYPSQPTCLEYDSIQQLLAIGTESGAVLLLGKPGLERHFRHPTSDAVVKLQFITNKGLLVTCCTNDTLYLWSLKTQEPKIVHTLEFTRENDEPTCLSHTYNSEWLYVGTKGSNVYLVHIPSFLLSGFTVHWNQALGQSARSKPGHVLAVLEHPMDQGKILIAYNGGLCVLYNMRHHDHESLRSNAADSKHTADHKLFSFDPGNNHILTSVCWVNCGRQIACSYSDGSIVIWNTKSETKPEKAFFLHETDPSQFKPIYKMQVIQPDGDPLFVCSGGFPESSDKAPRTLTVTHGKSSTMISCSSTIIDFTCLSSTPHLCDYQKPFALVLIAKNEIVFHDLSTPGYPKFPSYCLPYALDIHLPAVSYIHYSPLCPEEFIAQLHSVKSKMMTTSTKAWPLNGGRWGEEVPHSSTDIIITGHVDGSVRLWHCNSVIFQPFFTVDTSRYFKRNYTESPTKSSKSSSPLSSPTPTSQKVPPGRPPPPSHPPPKSKQSEKTLLRVLKTLEAEPEGQDSPGGVAEGTESESRSKVAASPATGQVHAIEQTNAQERTDGVPVRRSISFKDKLKKKRKTSKVAGKIAMDLPTPAEEGEECQEEGKTPISANNKKLKTSFQRMAKIVKLTRSVSDRAHRVEEDVDHGTTATIAEVPEEEEEVSTEGGSSSELPGSSNQHTPQPSPVCEKPSRKRPPPRPSAILLKKDSDVGPKVTLTPSLESSPNSSVFADEGEGPLQQRTKPHLKQSWSEEEESHIIKSRQSPHRLTSKMRFRPCPQTTGGREEAEEDFFVINYIHMCVCGLWLCVANNGGNVMAFDFCTKPVKQQKQSGFLDINFDYDSIKKQYTPSTTPPEGVSRNRPTLKSNTNPYPSPPIWTYDDRITDSSTGYQLTQLCCCYYTMVASSDERGNTPSPTVVPSVFSPSEKARGARMPVAVNEIQYSVNIGLLAMATRRGFALVDTHNSTCLYTLSSCISILYLSDPSKFTNQMKQESKLGVVGRPSIKRHATSIRFSEYCTKPRRKRIKSAATVPGSLHIRTPEEERGVEGGACEDTCEISVETESCVSTLELVQLQMDKSALPTLTLWVGLASGYVVAYIVNLVNSAAKRIELVPTRVLIETKSPLVSIIFLNEWGDRQVVPYKLDQALAKQGPCGKKMRSPSQSPLTLPSTLHYAVFVDEEKIKSYSFPGSNKINFVTVPLEGGNVILRSEYFTCQDLPCLATVTSCQYLYIHSLPGVKFLTALPLTSLGDPQTIGTFRVSGVGQGLYMSSASEIQRLCIVKENRLNFPDCLPSMHTKRADFSPNSGKGFLGTLFSGGPTTVNREEMFGCESAQHSLGDVAKVDGRVCRPYGSKGGSRSTIKSTRLDPERGTGRKTSVYRSASTLRKGEGGGGGGSKVGGLSGQMNKNLSALSERKEKLSAVENRTAEVADQASNYADLAARLAKKYGAK